MRGDNDFDDVTGLISEAALEFELCSEVMPHIADDDGGVSTFRLRPSWPVASSATWPALWCDPNLARDVHADPWNAVGG